MFWENLIKLCKNKNISPNKMCADLGLSTAIATKWKNGAMPRSTTMLRIAEYFDVDISYFEEKGSPSAELFKGLDESGVQILTIFSELPEDKKAEALSYLEFLVQKGKQDN